MDLEEKEKVLIIVKNMIRKRDKSLRLLFMPEQFIIGNHTFKLVQETPLTIENNSLGKLSVRVRVAADPMVGYTEKDLGIGLTKMEHIALKNEFQENPAAIMCTIKTSTFDKVGTLLTGVKEIVEKELHGNKQQTKKILFILKPWKQEPENYLKIEFRDNGIDKARFFDFETASKLLTNEVAAVWANTISEHNRGQMKLTGDRNDSLIDEITSHQWAQALATLHLKKSTCLNTGSVTYVRCEDSIYRKDNRINSNHMRNNGEKGYKLLAESCFDENEVRPIKKRKVAHDQFAQLIQWVGQEGWIEEQFERNKENDPFQTAYKKELGLRYFVSRTPSVMEYLKFQQVIWQTGNLMKKRKDVDESMEFDVIHALQNNNAQNTIPYEIMPYPPTYGDSNNSIEKVNQDVGHLREDVQNFFSIPDFSDQSFQQDRNESFHTPSMQQAGAFDNGDVVHSNQMNHLSHHSEQSVPPNTQQSHDYPTNVPVISALENHSTLPHAVQFKPQSSAGLYPSSNSVPNMTGAEVHPLFFSQHKPEEIQNLNGLSQGDNAAQIPQEQNVRPRMAVALRGSPRPDGNEQLFVFPPPGVGGSEHVTISVKDVRTLDRKEFLNDNVMSFMINYINYFMISQELRNKIFMSNTFIYCRLQRGLVVPQCFSGRKNFDPEHEKILTDNCVYVTRWTKRFDVFSKSYVVIPINEDLHWMVIAVINPGGVLVDVKDEAKSREAPKCYIVFYDPLSGLDPCKRRHMGHCIKRYLSVLFQQTKAPGKRFAAGKEYIYDEERIVLMRAKDAPIQDNFTDCGLYALHFIEGLFCSPNGPVAVEDYPDLSWKDIWPAAENMCDLMRDKVYNLILDQADQRARSRLDKYEKYYKCGLNREGKLRKARRHSALNRRIPRHDAHYLRHYSLSPPSRQVMYDDPTFTNPRQLATMPITQRVRELKIPEENFPIAY
uniref:ULP_PROTEASE domain-containing protein n=1 Tax=Caenorhabditis tropicalis TaxID=1561998 RepID=A0A1I7TS38_9PELO